MTRQSAPMEFLGYDPGGKDKHGVAAVTIARDGSYNDMQAECLRDATQVKEWLSKHPSAAVLGIDTLLAWSWSGARPCDNLLREHYGECDTINRIAINSIIEEECEYCDNELDEVGRLEDDPKWRNSKSVVSQNSLYSAMTLNGALVAMAVREDRPEFPLVESHPKLVLRAARGIGAAREHLVRGHAEALHEGKPHVARKRGPTSPPRPHGRRVRCRMVCIALVLRAVDN